MELTTIDGAAFKRMMLCGALRLLENKERIDALNVFPVPDGDTGTNMSLTLQVAAKEIERLQNPGAAEVAQTASAGSLRGARGNSGVILSQLLRGFAKSFGNKAELNVMDFANGFTKAAETAYKAVMRPKEGTILTVAAALADQAKASALETDDCAALLRAVIAHGNAVLAQTTDMLPELKQAGVVDAGGKGLMCILEGAYGALVNGDDAALAPVAPLEEAKPAFSAAAAFDAEITFGYCTEFFINVDEATEAGEQALKDYCGAIGDSLVVVGDGDIYKVHVHTEHPGDVLEYALKLGSLSNLKIENMRLQHSNLIVFPANECPEPAPAPLRAVSYEPAQELGFVAVSAGSGLSIYFEGLGVDEIIEGGQTMNPSTDDILEAIGRVNAKNVIVLPNNSNIILAANQAAELTTDKIVHVLPTKSIPQGISAMVDYLPQRSVSENFESMLEAIQNVKTGLVTYAVRSTVIDGRQIEEGDILCMMDGRIAAVSKSVPDGAKALLDAMMAEGGDIAGVYYGQDTAEDDAAELEAYILERHPDMDVEVRSGGQPIYYYIFSVE